MSALQAVVGLDVGTSRIKAGLVAADGTLLHLALRETPLRPAPSGGAYDPGELADRALDATREAAAAAHGTEIAGIGIASMAEAGVPLDEDGQPLDEIIAWFDTRAGAEAEELRSREAELFAVTGLRPEPKVTLARLMWLARRRPEVVSRMARWAGVADLVAEALGAPGVTAPSLACRTMAFDLGQRHWRRDLLAAAGVDTGQMPHVETPGEAHGTVSRAGSAASGLPQGAAITVAGHDHVVGALGAGGARAGTVADSIGTAEVALLSTTSPVLHDAARAAGLSSGLHALPGRAYLLGALPASGGLLAWLREVLGDAQPDSDAARETELKLEPYLRGLVAPAPDPSRTLTIRGLREGADAPAILGAALEAIADHMRTVIEALERVSRTPVTDVILYGGGTRIGDWPARRARINPWPTRVAATGESVCLGAAMLAATAAGLHASVESAAAAMAPAADPAR